MLRADDLKEQMASAEVRYMPAGGRNRWHNMASAAAGRMDDDDWKLAAQGAVNRLQVVSALRSGGVEILAGTDTPNPFVVPGFSLHDELELLVAAGLPPGDALAAATREAARFAAAPDWGVVETGKVADLVVLDANPLDRISHTRRIHGVMLRGRWISAADRSQLLDRLK
jgi:imidazolonepropionase-like amidohydrolase